MQFAFSPIPRAKPPSVSVIIPHFDRTRFLAATLESILQQTYSHYTVTIVDDHSSNEEFDKLKSIVAGYPDDAIRLLRNDENMGMVHSIYRGLEGLNDIFVAPIDPDDEWSPDYLEKMIRAHTNPNIVAPLAFCDQAYINEENEIISTVQSKRRGEMLLTGQLEQSTLLQQTFAFSAYIEPDKFGWQWTTTSSFMIRRAAMEMIRPKHPTIYKGAADGFIGAGTHMLGGSLFVGEPLTLRRLHDDNRYMTDNYCSIVQLKRRKSAKEWSRLALLDACRAFFENGADTFFRSSDIVDMLTSHITEREFAYLVLEVPELCHFLGDQRTHEMANGQDILTTRLKAVAGNGNGAESAAKGSHA